MMNMMMSHHQMMSNMDMTMMHGGNQNMMTMERQGNASSDMVPSMMLMHSNMLSGSNVLDSGWESPSTVAIKLQGNTASDDLAHIMVMVFPFSE